MPDAPYANSQGHLWDELRRVDYLVRAQTVRWRVTVAATKPPHLWGMLQVSDAEVDAYLSTPYIPPPAVPDQIGASAASYRAAAAAMVGRIRARRDQTPPEVTLRLDRLVEAFRLTPLERDLLLVCFLPELDERYRRLFGYLQDDASRTRPSVGLALQVLEAVASDEARAAATSPHARLVAQRLLAGPLPSEAEEPLLMRSLGVDDRITDYLLGGDQPDSRLRGVLWSLERPAADDDLVLDEDLRHRLSRLATWWGRRRAGADGAVLLFHGPYGSGRRAAAAALCRVAETPILWIRAEAALRNGPWEQAVDLAYREARLRDSAVCWLECQALLEREESPHDYLMAAAEGFPGLTILISQKSWDPAGRFRQVPFVRIDFPAPDYALRRRLWEAYLPPREEFAAPASQRALLADLLANNFRLTAGQMEDAVATARGLSIRRDPDAPRLMVDDLYEGCRRQSGRRLLSMARRIEPRTELTFDDLILPEPNRRQLQELRDRVQYRSRVYSGLGLERRLSLGRGLIALFTGSSGTGKTMAAELLAREQGVDLYKVDLSAVVSKYVGETEKNLGLVFAEAEDANAIIFFDEADALFGKRGEVREAQDRWANMEINYLLQRVEEYEGVVILASNLRQNIDEAFMRRIHVLADFPFPDGPARLRILLGLFPAGLSRPPPQELEPLAERFKLSGGSLKNVVIDAAFRALAEAGGQPPTITLQHLILGTAREYQKLGKPITKGEFGPDFYSWVEKALL